MKKSFLDWNLIYERSECPSEGAAELAFFWGPDLSGSLQGAGGVGCLVAVSIEGQFYFPCYDQNGNVTAYCDETGSLVAEYVYDTFGNTISSSGLMASVFPHRFSTKYYDAETDLYYYGYRYYSPSLGRWISRDPVEESGGVNLYSIAKNSCLSVFNILGERIGDWPDSSAEDGWAFAGDMNYPGPGWSGTFRTRPTTKFDLVAKIHDLHYATRNRLRTFSISVGGSKGSDRTVTRKTWETVPDFLSEVPDDRNPGFLRWMQLNMPDVLSRVYSITDQTDSSFVW